MAKTFKTSEEARAWKQEHEPRAPRAGDPAPDFELADARGEHPVRLSDLPGRRPVALVFGSFT